MGQRPSKQQKQQASQMSDEEKRRRQEEMMNSDLFRKLAGGNPRKKRDGEKSLRESVSQLGF